MSMSDWMKLEDIYANVYQIKCQRTFEQVYPTPRGSKKGLFSKYIGGGLALFSIMFVIWFPLMLFSLANQVGMRNLPIACHVRLSINGFPVRISHHFFILRSACTVNRGRGGYDQAFLESIIKFQSLKWKLCFLANLRSDCSTRRFANAD